MSPEQADSQMDTVVAQTAGALRRSQVALSPSEERAATEQAIAEEVVARMAG